MLERGGARAQLLAQSLLTQQAESLKEQQPDSRFLCFPPPPAAAAAAAAAPCGSNLGLRESDPCMGTHVFHAEPQDLKTCVCVRAWVLIIVTSSPSLTIGSILPALVHLSHLYSAVQDRQTCCWLLCPVRLAPLSTRRASPSAALALMAVQRSQS